MTKRLMLIFSIAVAANASTLGPLSGTGWNASAFNVVTLVGDFAPSSDVGGRVAVYGSYTGNGYQIASQYSTVPDAYTDNDALIVNGNITTNSFTVGDGSTTFSASVGGTYSPSVFNSPKPTMTTSDFDFIAARTALDNLSSNTLAHYAGAITATPTDNGTNFVVSPTGSGTFVYNVDASYFTNQNRGFEVDLTNNQSTIIQSVIINVTGNATNLTLSKGTVVKYNGNTVNANTMGGVPVLFNFANTNLLGSSNGSINGSVLAPYATFSSNQTVDGQLIVAAVNGLAETHDQYYSGSLPSVATPEPANFALLGGGLILLSLVRRKR